MKRKKLMKVLYLTLIASMSTGVMAYADTISTTFESRNQLESKFTDSISNQLKALEEKYGVIVTPTKEISQKDIPLIEKSIKDSIKGVDALKAKVSAPEKVEFNSLTRAYQDYSGTTHVEAYLPAIGYYNVYIPYKYTVVQAGGNPPYFTNASTGVSYGAGIALGAYSHQDSWASITSQNGRYNNVLNLNAKGTIVYSAGPANITLPNQVFLKSLYL